jgi:nicotinate-nucleotide pyrophosphorylase (carboxylating)
VEVSGGITAENLLEYASAQVDTISMGALTHSAKALDISLEVTAVK